MVYAKGQIRHGDQDQGGHMRGGGIDLPYSQLVVSVMLVGVLFCCLALPRILTELYGFYLPRIQPFSQPGAFAWTPFVLVVFVTNCFAASGGRSFLARIEDVDIFFLMCVIAWTSLEWVHGLRGPFSFDADLIIELAWVQIFYMAIRSFDYVPDIRSRVVDLSIILITLGSAIQILALLHWIPSALPYLEPFRQRPDFWSFVNRGASISGFGIVLAYFFSRLREQTSRRQFLYHTSALINALFIVLTQSRGATLVTLMTLVSGILVPRLRGLSVKLAVGLLGSVLVIGLIFGRIELQSLAKTFLYNRPLISGQIRLSTAQSGIQEFLSHPLVGIGLGQAHTLRWEGWQIHTHYVLILASYGLCGTVTYLLYIYGFRPRTRKPPLHIVAVGIVLFLGSSTLFPYCPGWYAILGYLMRRQSSIQKGMMESPGRYL
jgi:hypothetical protein